MAGVGRAEFIQLFHVLELVGLGAVGSGILIGVGQWSAAVGVSVGIVLFVAKSYFLYETGKALIKRHDRGRVSFIAGFAGIGRLLFVGVALAVIAQFSTVVLLAAGGGLILCQFYFHFLYLIKKGGKQCPEG